MGQPRPVAKILQMHRFAITMAVLRGVTLAFGFVLPWIPVLVVLAAAAFRLFRRLRR
jgi:hypothetical protein